MSTGWPRGRATGSISRSCEPVPFDPSWWDLLAANVATSAELSSDERARLETLTGAFLGTKHWEAARGFDVTEEMRVTIAAQACQLVLGLDLDWYRDVHIPELLAVPGFLGARRFKIHPDDAAAADPGRPQYLIVYDIEADDIFEPIREMRERRRTSPPDLIRDTVLRMDPPAIVTVYEAVD